MAKHTWAERIEIINRTLAPEELSYKELSEETGISINTLYAWKRKIKMGTIPKTKRKKILSTEDKFHIVMETIKLNETDINEYCRKKGIYSKDVKIWQNQCIGANGVFNESAEVKQIKNDLRSEKAHSKELEKELNRKEKALAETAALLVLKKKAQAIWGDEEN